ncbi:MAG: NADH-quinone oxidoreductase subunit A [Chloroflexota bacterium]|nr:NADH-quinone oxidoreductase subunit A [Chloroflexota bacterium]
MELANFQFIGILAIVAFIFPFVGVFVASLLRPKKPNRLKNVTYECGVETYGDAWSQFKAQYYLFALIFVIFDVEAVFLFPWAVAYDKLPLYALFEVAVFVLILLAGLVYAWRTGALEWN